MFRTGSPGLPAWNWITTYFMGMMDRYAGPAPFTKTSAAELRWLWLKAAREKISLMIASHGSGRGGAEEEVEVLK